MYYGSNRATAITLSTMLLALLLASSFTSIPLVHGIGVNVSPKDYPIFCDSTGNFTVTINTGTDTWTGVALEIPKEFGGLADGDASMVSATGITYDERFIQVYDEELYYPYDREYWWVEIVADSTDYDNWPGISGTALTLTIADITAPSIARYYTVTPYYTKTNFPCTYRAPGAYPPLDFSDGNRGTALPDINVKVYMREEASRIEGYVRDTSYATGGELTSGYVTASVVEVEGLPAGKVVAKTTIASNGFYSLRGLYEGTYKLTAWGKITKYATVFAYTPTELALSVTVGRKATLTGVNIAATKGGEISGYLRLYDGVTPISPSSVFGTYFTIGSEINFNSPNAWLPVRLELEDQEGTVVAHTTVNVPSTANLISYSLKEVTKGTYKYAGIPAGTYKLKAYACGFVQTADVSVSVTAPGGVTIDVPIVKGGGVQGTLYYLTSQGISTNLGSGKNILVEAYNTAGVLKGVWIGTTTSTTSTTFFVIRGTGEAIKPVATGAHTTVALKTYSGRGVKDYGLADGGYTIRVSVQGFVQPTPYPTAVISYAAMGAVSIYLKQGGEITGTVHAKDPTGVYAENWQRAAVPAWEYNSATTQTRIRTYIYDSAGAEVGYTTVLQNSGTQTTTFSFSGRGRSTADLQSGYKQTALADGTYTVKVYSWGYWLPTPYPTATIYSGGSVNIDAHMRRGGSVAGTVTFREAGILLPAGQLTGKLAEVEATDAAGVTKGVTFVTLTSTSTISYSIWGLYKADDVFDGGITDGAYTVVFTLKGFAHPTQTVTVAGGSSATSNFDAYRMGSVTGTIRGAVTYQATPIKMSWVKITLSASPVQYTTYSAEGIYSLSVPDGTYTMTFAAYGYEPYTVTVSVSSGATQVISADLVESFEPIPEFPLGAVFTLAASLGLALYLLRWTRKPITPKI